MIEELIAGDTLDFLDSVPEYPPADGWTLKYRLVPRFTSPVQAPIDITASTSGSDYRVQAAASVTAAWSPGAYTWARWVEKAGPIRQSLGEGQIQIKPDPSAAVQGYDGRSQARKAVEDLEAAMAVFQATSGRVKSYSIGSRQMEFESSDEIKSLLSYWRGKLANEEATERLDRGQPGMPRLLARL